MRKRIKETYELFAENYDKRYVGSLGDLYRYEESLFEESVKLEDGNWILDLGTGTGRFAVMAMKKDIFFVGIDFSRVMIKKAKKKHAGTKNAEFMVADVQNLPFRPASFDRGLSVGMFEYVSQPEKALSEIEYILKVKGRLCINVWNKLGVLRLPIVVSQTLGKSSFRRTAFKPDEFCRRLENSGFKVVKVQGYFFIPPSLLKGPILNWFSLSNIMKRLDRKFFLRNITSNLLFSASK